MIKTYDALSLRNGFVCGFGKKLVSKELSFVIRGDVAELE